MELELNPNIFCFITENIIKDSIEQSKFIGGEGNTLNSEEEKFKFIFYRYGLDFMPLINKWILFVGKYSIIEIYYIDDIKDNMDLLDGEFWMFETKEEAERAKDFFIQFNKNDLI